MTYTSVDECPVCNDDGWVALPLWANKEKSKVRLCKVRCRCGISIERDQIAGVMSREEFDRLSRPN